MPRYGYLVVEGQADVEFVARVLELAGLPRVRKKSLLDSFWDRLVPKTFPHGDDLLKRVPVPLFLQNNDHAIAIHSATGLDNIAKTVQESMNSLLEQREQIQAIGFVLDADTTKSPAQRLADLEDEINRLQVSLFLPAAPGY